MVELDVVKQKGKGQLEQKLTHHFIVLWLDQVGWLVMGSWALVI